MANIHGGKREGAGRKKKENSTFCVRVPDEILASLKIKYPNQKDLNIKVVKFLKRLSKKLE